MLCFACAIALSSGAIKTAEPKLITKLAPVNSASYDESTKDLTAAASDRSKWSNSNYIATYLNLQKFPYDWCSILLKMTDLDMPAQFFPIKIPVSGSFCFLALLLRVHLSFRVLSRCHSGLANSRARPTTRFTVSSFSRVPSCSFSPDSLFPGFSNFLVSKLTRIEIVERYIVYTSSEAPALILFIRFDTQ